MKKMKMILAILIVSMSLVSLVSAASVTPYYVEKWKAGNAEYECQEAKEWLAENTDVRCSCDFAYKIDNWSEDGMDGTYLDYGNSITIYSSDGKSFSWSSDLPVCCVIVKASTHAYIYYYNPAVKGDGNLVAPEGKDISHVTFCMQGPDFKIPETSLGTIASLITMLGAAVLLRSKAPLLK